MAATSPELNFPADEIHYRVEHVKNSISHIIRSSQDLQRKLLIREDIGDQAEKTLMHRVDSAMEDVLVQLISQKFTNDFFLCEVVGQITGKNDFCWVIDAIDGSMNFLRAIPMYGISIGLQYRNHLVAGIVVFPDYEDVYSAILGQGAYKNGERIYVSKISTLESSILISSFPSSHKSVMREIISEISSFVNSGRSIRRTGSIVLDLCWIAEGKVDGLWEREVEIFDIAGIEVLLKEAGGKITNFQGESPASYPSSIIATNGLLHKQVQDVLKRTRTDLNLN
jgi:myo-inositol-1(or 4)-monophosphatase